jgi:hypothetical protein
MLQPGQFMAACYSASKLNEMDVCPEEATDVLWEKHVQILDNMGFDEADIIYLRRLVRALEIVEYRKSEETNATVKQKQE